MKGLIFIPDISGFTNFVRNIDIDLGVAITRDLLTIIIDNNSLGMELSEIEGDAILFYKTGKPPHLKHILDTFESMCAAFHASYQRWKIKYNLEQDLSLKLIVHYGDFVVYDIRGFRKLYGETVIEAHNLLKNGNGGSDYILVTDKYLTAMQQKISDVDLFHPGFIPFKSYLSTDVKRINYYYFLSISKTAPVQKDIFKNKPLLLESYN